MRPGLEYMLFCSPWRSVFAAAQKIWLKYMLQQVLNQPEMFSDASPTPKVSVFWKVPPPEQELNGPCFLLTGTQFPRLQQWKLSEF